MTMWMIRTILLTLITELWSIEREFVLLALWQVIYVYNKNNNMKVTFIIGEIGHFTFQALLIQLTTSVALIKVATIAVDLIAINFLPR